MSNRDNTYGWIYLIVCNDTKEAIYVGSTSCIQSRQALHKHKTNCFSSVGYNKPMYQYIREHGGFFNFQFKISWRGTIASRRDLHEREQTVIDTYSNGLLFNRNDAVRNVQQAAKTARERSLKYYHDHSGHINRRVQCPCGAIITYNGRTMHNRTQKHKAYEPAPIYPLFSWVE